MQRTSKSEFLRGVGEFNPSAYGVPGTLTERMRLASKITAYGAQRGGTWNYDNLYSTFVAVLKGYSVDQARSGIAALDGPGEAAAKLGIFDGLCKYIPLDRAKFVAEGGQRIAFGRHEASVRPDFSFKTDAGIFCVFVYPNKFPVLKERQRQALLSALATPMRDEPHFFILVEYPEISGKRNFKAETYEFCYRSIDEDFLSHMEVFYDLLDEHSGGGDLFGRGGTG